MGCSAKEPPQEQIAFTTLLSVNTGPKDHQNNWLSYKASTMEEMQNLWAYFQVQDDLPTVDFAINDVYFFKYVEAGRQLDITTITQSNKVMQINLDYKQEKNEPLDCFAVEKVRTSVILLEKTATTKVTFNNQAYTSTVAIKTW